MAKYYYTNMISALATGQISYRDAMCEILKRLCELENEKVQYQADWTETDSTSPSYIQHKPSVQEFQADWNETNSTAYGYIQNKPDLQEFQADWNETDPNSLAFILNKPPVRTGGLDKPSLIPPSKLNSTGAYLRSTGSFGYVSSADVTWNEIKPAFSDKFQEILNNYWNQADWQETDQNSPSYIRNKPSLPSALYPRASWSRYTQCFTYHGTLPAGANNVWGLQCVKEWIPGKFWHFHGWVCLYTADNSGVTTPFFNYGIDMGSVVEHTDLTVADLYQAYISDRMYSQSKKYVRYTDSAINPQDAFAALQFTEQQIGGVIELTYDADATYPCLGRHCAYVYSGSTMELQDYPLAQQRPGFIEFEIWVNPKS